MAYLFIGLGIALFAYAVLNWYANASPRNLIGGLKWFGVGLAAIVGIVLIATGRFGLLWVVLMGALPWISRLGNLAQVWRNLSGPSGGQSSTVKTRFLAMSLDHDSGRMDGVVLEGHFENRRLSELQLAELRSLLHEVVAEDPQSAELLEAYLDRAYPGQWRDENTYAGGGANSGGDNAGGGQSRGGRAGKQTLSREEALEVLGLKEGASEDEIRAAHRRLMKLAHPDTGGSDYLAARINEAKETLLNS